MLLMKERKGLPQLTGMLVLGDYRPTVVDVKRCQLFVDFGTVFLYSDHLTIESKYFVII